jgi:hypothetical protein
MLLVVLASGTLQTRTRQMSTFIRAGFMKGGIVLGNNDHVTAMNKALEFLCNRPMDHIFCL